MEQRNLRDPFRQRFDGRNENMKEKIALCLAFLLLTALLPALAFCGASSETKPSSASSSASQESGQKDEASAASEAESSKRQESSKSEKGNASGPSGQPSETAAGKDDIFKILDTSTDSILEVSRMDFLRGAAAAEMPLSFETEALAAQAVAAYTYYGRLREKNRDKPDENLKGADFSADISKWEKYATKEQMQERWGDNFDAYYEKLTQAAEKADGYVLTYEGELIDATYYAISAGVTESSKDIWGGELPYLTQVASPGDELAAGFLTTETFSSEDLKKALSASFPSLSFPESPGDWFGKLTRSSSGSVTKAEVCGQELEGGELRSALGLRSQNFTVSQKDGSFTFSVKGYGHGVGMSQTGAQYMAKQGSDFKAILSWYYPGAKLAKIG